MKDIKQYIRNLSYDFSIQRLDESQVSKSPILQFEQWFKDAVDAQVSSPNAMVLSTASKEGVPSARIMLLRNFDENGFVFYTNYHSKKADHLTDNPFAALTFFWAELERQVRIEGIVKKQDDRESDEYFAQRPEGSKLGAWSSQQSHVIANRAELDQKYADIQQHFSGKEIPRPAFWGGYTLKPTLFEFWQGRPSRMHDRIIYKARENQQWKIERLSP